MDEFILKEIKHSKIIEELNGIGFDKAYQVKAAEKFMFKVIKIFGLSLAQANILKQSALSLGADCGVHREVLSAKVDTTDCILGGSFSQLRKIAQKLEAQPFKMPKLAKLIQNQLDFKLAPMKLGQTVFDFKTPYIVGVLNLTTNSFSDGGEFFDFDKACTHLLKMIEEGADIIELGAESTKPFSDEVPAEKQLEKLVPILNFIAKQNISIPISIDTRSAKVASKCIELNASIINDVSGLVFDPDLVKILGQTPIIIQHSKGEPDKMQLEPKYEHLMDEIFLNLQKKIEFARQNGVGNIIIDAGIGFGKTRENNFEILQRIEELKSLGCPIMIGVSRKSLLNMKHEPNEIKDIYTLALNAQILDKVDFIRVHNVALHKKLINMLPSQRK